MEEYPQLLQPLDDFISDLNARHFYEQEAAFSGRISSIWRTDPPPESISPRIAVRCSISHRRECPSPTRTSRFSCGGFQRGTGVPLCVVVEEGVTGEKPHRKGFSLRACFWLLFARAKSNSGCGAESPIKFRKETCFVTTRPAMGESALHRPDALAQTDQNVPSARRGRSTLLSLSDPLIHRVQNLRHALAQPGKLLGQRLRVHRRELLPQLPVPRALA